MTASPIQIQLTALTQIQELDLKIDQIKKKQEGFPAALKDLDGRMVILKRNFDLKTKTSAELEKLIRQNEAAQSLNQDRSTRAAGKLEEVKTGPEFQSANKEIEQLKRMNSQLADQIGRIKADLELAGIALKAAADEMALVQAERDATSAEIEALGSSLDLEIASIESQKKAFVSAVKPQLLSQYNRVRGARAGLGLAPTIQGRCGACHMMIPPQMYNQIQKGTELHDCLSCHRILFVPN